MEIEKIILWGVDACLHNGCEHEESDTFGSSTLSHPTQGTVAEMDRLRFARPVTEIRTLPVPQGELAEVEKAAD